MLVRQTFLVTKLGSPAVKYGSTRRRASAIFNPWTYPVGERLGKQKAMAVHVDVQESRSHYVQHDGMSQMNGITC